MSRVFRARNGAPLRAGGWLSVSAQFRAPQRSRCRDSSRLSFRRRPPFPYAQLPLLCLERIWEHRLIPVVPNVPALLHVEARAPGRMAFWEVAERGLKKTALLHEAVHCIARTVVRGPGRPRSRSRQQQILELLFEESCANAAEALCCALAVSDWHRLFAQMHFYDTPLGCSFALERLGFRYAFELQVIACLHSNFLRDDISSARIWAIARDLVPALELQLLGRAETVAFFRRAFCLNREFRAKIAAVSFKLAGFSRRFEGLLDFDFSGSIAAGQPLRRALSSIAAALQDGLSGLEQAGRRLGGGYARDGEEVGLLAIAESRIDAEHGVALAGGCALRVGS